MLVQQQDGPCLCCKRPEACSAAILTPALDVQLAVVKLRWWTTFLTSGTCHVLSSGQYRLITLYGLLPRSHAPTHPRTVAVASSVLAGPANDRRTRPSTTTNGTLVDYL
jgi:hypothetical protein